MNKFIINDEPILDEIKEKLNDLKRYLKFRDCALCRAITAVLIALLIIGVTVAIVKCVMRRRGYDDFLFDDDYDEDMEDDDDEDEEDEEEDEESEE